MIYSGDEFYGDDETSDQFMGCQIPDTIDVYHPLVESDHDAKCAALCTDYYEEHDEPNGGCTSVHRCWCPDGALSYAEFQAKYPDVTVAEA